MPQHRTISVAAVLAGLVVPSIPSAQGPGSEVPFSIAFAAVVAGAPLECGKDYAAVGTTRSTISITDFKMYVSKVRVIDNAGRETPLALVADGVWQTGDAALLDFENGTGGCSNGTAPMRTMIEGRAPEGAYAGLQFDVGLPFDLNHRDPTLQPSPLNLSRLFWNWNAGYKFARIDMRSTGQPQGWVLHLGSTGCTPRQGPTSVPTSCANENRPTITLPAFDRARDVIQFDLAAMLAESNVDVNTEETAAGCMSAASDPECGGVLRAFGLKVAQTDAAPRQRVFSAVPAAGRR